MTGPCEFCGRKIDQLIALGHAPGCGKPALEEAPTPVAAKDAERHDPKPKTEASKR